MCALVAPDSFVTPSVHIKQGFAAEGFIKPQKWYVSFKKANSHICALEIQKNGIKLTINVAKGHLEDSKQLTRDISTVGHFGNGKLFRRSTAREASNASGKREEYSTMQNIHSAV